MGGLDGQALAQWPVSWTAAILVVLAALWVARDSAARIRALADGALADGGARPHSLPLYHGWHGALMTAGPPLLLLCAFEAGFPALARALLAPGLPESVAALGAAERAGFWADVAAAADGAPASGAVAELAAGWQLAEARLGLAAGFGAVLAGAIGLWAARRQAHAGFRARNAVERVGLAAMALASAVAILTTIGIVFSLLFETVKFFSAYNPLDFLFGTQWSPQIAIRADQIGQSGAFGAVPLFAGTLLIMAIAMAVAVPVGLGSAIYLSEYASPRARARIKPALEILAGIPTVVFGFFALLTVAPAVRAMGAAVGLDVAAQSALAAGLVMGIMIIPFISSLSDDVINAVPQALRDGSYAMGATRSETIRKVILPAALPGVVGSILLAVSKALGETMIVKMAAGQNANLSLNPLDMVTTVTVQIVTLLTGDQEYDSPKTHAAFALGFVLFFVTLTLNIIAMRVVQAYRERYD